MSTPKIITVACAKGGATKTTTSMLIAGSLARRGEKVVVLDTDNTGGATKWADYVEDGGGSLGFSVVPTPRPRVNRERISRLYEGWVIIDTPPSDTATIQAAINAADVTIVPTQPATADLTLAGETYDSSPNAVVLLVRVKPRTTLARDAIAELDGARVNRFETVVTEREGIKRLYGTTQIDNKEYGSVTQELIDYVASLGKDGE